jgi:proteasome ATPase
MNHIDAFRSTSQIRIVPETAAPTDLSTLLAENAELRDRLASLMRAPAALGFVSALFVRDGAKWMQFFTGPGQITERPFEAWMQGARVGMCVRVAQTPAGPIPYTFGEMPPTKGAVVEVTEVHDGFVIFRAGGLDRTVACGAGVQKGDRVLLDQTEQVVVDVLAREVGKKENAEQGVEWDDIGGHVEVKRQLREAIEEPILHREIHERFNKKRVKGIALFGPPGTGKTLLARACASSLAKLHGKSASEGGFIYVKGPELLSALVGSSESNVRQIFADARRHHEEHGYPSLVFIDEADGILTKRGISLWAGVEKTVVPQFLAEMDGLDEHGATVLFATNRPDVIDPAFLRPGRIDLKIEVGRPSQVECCDIFDKVLRGKPLADPRSIRDGDLAAARQEFCTRAAEELFSSRWVLETVVDKERGRERVTLADRASGALVMGIAEKATQRAIRRAIVGEEGPGSIALADVKAAVAEVAAEEIGMSGSKQGTKSGIIGV